MIKSYWQSWNLMRGLRFTMGVFFVGQGIVTHDTFVTILGTIFSIMALANLGCCGVTGCAVHNDTDENKNDEVIYEEVGKKL